MLLKAKKFCKKIFRYAGVTGQRLTGSAGLFLLKDYMVKTGLPERFSAGITDMREQFRIRYSASELHLCGVLRILNGQFRHSHSRNTDVSLFETMYGSGTVPDFRTLIYYHERNPHLWKEQEKILYDMCTENIRKRMPDVKNPRITLDIDQTAKAVYGRQAGARKGYSAKERNSKLFQCAVWTVRETKTVLKIELLPGETHSGCDLLERLRPTLEKLKKDGFRLRLVLDSGYENTAVFDYLESEGIEFICAAKQRKAVKLRGRNAKNRTLLKEKGNVTAFIKERKLNTPEGSEFRQIYVQNRIACDEHGQLYFKEFDSGEFTNVFVTNMKISRKNIYKIYRKHASVETVIEELKNDFGLAASHSSFFPVNCAMAQTCAIAYNVKNMFVAEYSVLRNKKETVKLSTFQRKFINIPGIIANRSGRTVLRLEHSAFQKLKGYFSIFGYNINAFS